MNSFPNNRFLLLFSIFLLGSVCSLFGQAELVSVNPPNNATGVSPTTTIVFTFNEPMDVSTTEATFIDGNTFTQIPANQAWNPNGTVMTYTPTAALPASHLVFWSTSGDGDTGDVYNGDFGQFTVASSGGGSGTGTNKTTTFSLGKTHFFDQTSTAAPVLDATLPYGFSATTGLASNRTATSISLGFPTSATSNLTVNPIQPENYFLFSSSTNLATFDATVPTGNYLFTVNSSQSNQQVTVNLSASLTQPNAPHISNFTAAQSVNATQAFTLSWDAFSGGTAADFIFVNIGGVFQSAQFGSTGALSGTVTSFLIPTNTLQANSNYDSSIGFYHATVVSNANYTTIAYIASVTQFTLTTTSGSSVSPPVLTNFVKTATNFMFDVKCSPGQLILVDSTTNLLTTSVWTNFYSSNSTANFVHVDDRRAATNKMTFYRARISQ
jgi:hypothetical protein